MSPARLPVGSIEEFITITGTDLSGTTTGEEGETIYQSTVTFTAEAGTTSTVSNYASPDGTKLIVAVPSDVAFTVGEYTIDVYAVFPTHQIHSGPAAFTIYQPVIQAPPLVSVPEVLVAEATSVEGAAVTYENVSAVSADGLTTYPVTCTPPSGTIFGFGTHGVSCSATNEFGTTTNSFTVIVSDFTPPVVTVPDDFVATSATVEYSVSATDNVDGTVSVSCSPASGTVFPTGTTVVNCVAYDNHLNPGHASFRVTVADGAPVLTVPETLIVETTETSTVVNFTVTATAGATVTCTPASGSTFAVGYHIVSCTATNSFGSASGAFEVIVAQVLVPADTTPPVITVADVTAEATGPDGAAVTFVATAIDDVSGVVPVTCTPPSGSTFEIGLTTVNCTATDAAGNTGNASFTVSVFDTTPPTVTEITATPNTLWPADHKMVNVTISVTAIDATDPAPTAEIVSVWSSQPTNGTGDGDMAPDWNITGALTLQLRSERSHGKDRTYTITVRTTDIWGNSTLSSVDVKVTQQSSSKKRAVSP